MHTIALADPILVSEAFMQPHKFLHTPRLNAAGLHTLRALVAEVGLRTRRRDYLRERGSHHYGAHHQHAHSSAKALHRLRTRVDAWIGSSDDLATATALEAEGYVVFTSFDRHSGIDRRRLLAALRVAAADSTLRLPCGSAAFPAEAGGGCDVERYPECCDGNSWLKVEEHTHFAHDSQYEMHSDTFQPTFKFWIFEEPVTVGAGPLHYANGSHTNSVAKLAWLHAKSQHPARSMLACPSPRPLLHSAAVLGYGPLRPFVLPARSLLIVDTSGFHARGRAPPGTRRRALRPRWYLDSLPRSHTLAFGIGAGPAALAL